MKIFQVVEVAVLKIDKQLHIFANGMAATTGWTNPRLTADDPNPDDAVLEFAFEADRPSGVSLPVLMPISTSLTIDVEKDVDGVIVKARSNSVTVHVSEFQTGSPVPPRPPITTQVPASEGPLTTLRLGEEGPPMTTLRLGEEGPPTTMLRHGEEDPPFTTMGIVPGEEDPITPFRGEGLTTFRFGEEGPLGTDPRVDDPAGPLANGGLTTLALGEEGGPIDPRMFGGGGSPFGGF
jgi:hypothetical protein